MSAMSQDAANRTWRLRYAAHLGYRSPAEPLFRETVGSLDPVAHVDHAAALGFAGMQYVLAASRPLDEQRRVAKALERHGLEPGCVLWTGFDRVRTPLLGVAGAEARARILAELRGAFEAAKRLNARHVAVIGAADPAVPIAIQLSALVENLKYAAEAAERERIVLCLESLSRRSLPGMLIQHIGDAYAVVKAVASPAVRLIFDTSHVQIMDGDLLENLSATWETLAVIQLADNPGRFEPGSGEINFGNILRAIHGRRYRGLVELEHLWAHPSVEAEKRLIEHLESIEASFQ